MAEAFTDLLPIGILGGDSLSGLVPVLVVNCLLVPSVLSVRSLWPDTDNSSSIWRPSEVKIAHFDVSWQHPAFCCICFWKQGPCLEELSSALVGVGRGGGIILLFPPSLCSPCCPSFLFDLTIKSFLVFMSDVYPRAAWEMAGWRRRLRKCARASYHLW